MQRPFTIVQHSAISPAICEGCNDVLPCFPHNPDDCWVLRRGKIQVVRDSVSPIRCARVKGLPAGGYLPIPLAAQAVCACFPPKLHYGIQTLLCRSLLFNVSKQQVAWSMQWAT